MASFKVGDLVCLAAEPSSEDELGIIVKVDTKFPSDIDAMFPYLVHFADGDADYFGERHLGLVSESR